MRPSLFPVALFLALPAFAQLNLPPATVDFFTTQTPKSVSGFLHGASAFNPPDATIGPLAPKLWRVGNYNVAWNASSWPASYSRFAAAGARVEVVLSDLWNNGNGYDPSQPAPYDNWANWESFVQTTAIANSTRNIIWEIWNEPDNTTFWHGTQAQLLETYARAVKVLRAQLGPSVLIGGLAWSNYSHANLQALLDYCVAQGCDVNFVSWHELYDSNARIAAIPNDAQDARALIANPKYAGLNIHEIHINETVGILAKHMPGAILGYFYYLENAAPDAAAKSCWNDSLQSATNPTLQHNECYNDPLDGLLTWDTMQPRSAWWAYKFYADGVGTRVASSTTDSRVVALGSASTNALPAQVLLGYYDFNASAQNANITLQLQNLDRLPWLAGTTQVQVNVETIPNTDEAALPNTKQTSNSFVGFVSGVATVTLNSVAPGTAFRLTLARPQAAPATCQMAIGSTSASIPMGGGTGTVAVSASDPACAWQAYTSASWITLASSSKQGTGPGTVSYSVLTNTGPARSGTITIAGYVFQIQQAGTPLPAISAVVHAATYQPGIAPGAFVAITGTALAPDTRQWGNTDFAGGTLPTALDGTSVKIGGVPAYISYISPTQVNVIVPASVAIGSSVPVQVSTSSGSSAPFMASVTATAPGFFTFSQQSGRYAAAVFSDGTYAGPAGLLGASVTTRAARAGDVIVLYATGLGPLQPGCTDGTLFTTPCALATAPVVQIGGMSAKVLYAGAVADGFYQINAVVPALLTGDAALTVSAGGLTSPAGVFLAIGQ